MSNSMRILVHPRCRSCEATFSRRVRSTDACTECGRVDWIERHELAFELIRERADGWFGIQDYENVHPGDEVELLIAGEWRAGKVDRLDALGFYVSGVRGGLELEYRSFENERSLWRWPGDRTEKGWVGPFASKEAAESVRYDHAPGYLVCGVCGWDGWKTDVAGHYRTHHGPLSDPDALAADEARRRPARRIVA